MVELLHVDTKEQNQDLDIVRKSVLNKKDAISESLRLVKEYYGYSNEKAKQALSVLSDEQLAMIEQKLYKGGK